jgi:hypothetical protein
MDVRHWGSTTAERAVPLPCDDLVDGGETLHRAVTIDAPPEVVYRWLCQLRVAPYSYDLIDNLGRRSPQELTPGLEHPAPGQIFVRVFRLVHVEPDRSLTLVWKGPGRPFGDLAITYAALPDGASATRLLMRLRWRHTGGGPLGALWRLALPPLDLVMARRQLRNFKRLAERSARG